jgi:hypothetical protein
MLLVLALLGPACAPVHEGPQLGTVPEGLAYTNTLDAAGHPLPRRQKVRQIGYIPTGEERWPLSVIITEYAGATTFAEIGEARDELLRRHGSSTEYSELEPITIDGHQGWGWLETYRYKGEVESAGFTVVVSYATNTYGIQVETRKPKLRNAAYLKGLAATFAVRHTTDLDGLVLIMGGLLLGGILALIWRTQKPGRRPAADTVTRLLGH